MLKIKETTTPGINLPSAITVLPATNDSGGVLITLVTPGNDNAYAEIWLNAEERAQLKAVL